MNHILIFSQGQKKEHLDRMREIKFRETSADTEWIKYYANRIKTGSPKNIDLLKAQRRHSWICWSNKIEQHFCWSPVNHCYKCTKQKIISSKHEKQNERSGNIRQYVYYNCFLTRLWRLKISNQPWSFQSRLFDAWPKSQGKNLNILRTKRAFEVK